jgi:gas vesicle protein
MWSKLKDKAEGEDRVRQRQTSGDFWANLVNNGPGKSAKLVEYHDHKDSAHNIIRMLMNKNKKPLQLQLELHEAEGRLFDTTAGQQLDSELGATAAEKLQRMHALEMKQFKEEYKEKIDKLKKEIQALQRQKEMIRERKVREFLFLYFEVSSELSLPGGYSRQSPTLGIGACYYCLCGCWCCRYIYTTCSRNCNVYYHVEIEKPERKADLLKGC